LVGVKELGGAEFSCLNTGEDRPRVPARFRDIELDDCTFEAGSLAGVQIDGARLDRMTIDGMVVTELIEAYQRAHA
jgi:hypothetical protein